jgi:hypothetical protein
MIKCIWLSLWLRKKCFFIKYSNNMKVSRRRMRSTSEVYCTGKFGDIPFKILRPSQGRKSETLSTSTFFWSMRGLESLDSSCTFVVSPCTPDVSLGSSSIRFHRRLELVYLCFVYLFSDKKWFHSYYSSIIDFITNSTTKTCYICFVNIRCYTMSFMRRS